MISTRDDRAREVIGALFDDVLAPIAESLRACGVELFPLRPDMSRRTYYVLRTKLAMTHEDFTSPSCADVEEFASRLASHWKDIGRDHLSDKASHFASAARAAYALGDQDAEVSPFVYVMF
jgi:hypothetical protein